MIGLIVLSGAMVVFVAVGLLIKKIRGKNAMNRKGHGGLELSWWQIFLTVLILIWEAIKQIFRPRQKGQNPHDISGEPDIPGGDRP